MDHIRDHDQEVDQSQGPDQKVGRHRVPDHKVQDLDQDRQLDLGADLEAPQKGET